MKYLGLAMVALTSLAASPAQAHSDLSPAEAGKRVCVPTRDKVGQPDGGTLCMTGLEWERTLAKKGYIGWRPRPRALFPQAYLADYGTGRAWRF